MIKTSNSINGEIMFDRMPKTAEDIIKKIEDLIKEGNIRRIIIRDQEGEIFIELPVLIGAVVTVAAPYVTAIGILAGFAAKFSVEIIKKDNKKILLLSENNPINE